MKKFAGTKRALFVLSVLAISGLAVGQDKPMGEMPPKVLTIMREYTKPGKAGTPHEKTESLFIQAMSRAKWPTHYLAVDSLSGKSRSLFMTGYDSFDAWEKDVHAEQKNAVLSAGIDHASAVDGEMLSEIDQAVGVFREDLSFRPQIDVAHTRYFEISLFQVKQGHDKDFAEIVKMVSAAYAKIPGAHWITYQCAYGLPDTSYIIFNPMKMASEIDQNFAAGKDFEAAMGEDGMKKLNELVAASIDASQTNLFMVNPRTSYAADAWIKADPDFWKPKAASGTPVAKKAEGKAAEEKK
jgi:hypothetical protein